jgi:small conductance mechanosensitive channel
MEKASLLFDAAMNFVAIYGPKVLGAILIFIIGSWIVKKNVDRNGQDFVQNKV